MSMPYARSLPWVTTNMVSRVPGKPKMKLTTFHKVVPLPCARIAVKLKFAKIQIADAPPSAAGEVAEVISIDSARRGNTTDATANADGRRAQRSKNSQRAKKGGDLISDYSNAAKKWHRSQIPPGREAFPDVRLEPKPPGAEKGFSGNSFGIEPAKPLAEFQYLWRRWSVAEPGRRIRGAFLDVLRLLPEYFAPSLQEFYRS
jgi:hypothetical protein